MKQKTKRSLTITVLAIVALFVAFVIYVKLKNPNSLWMDYRYNKVITEPLAKIGFADAQFKMGVFWFYGSGTEPNKAELDNAIYWWEKASGKGNEDARQELAKAKE